jgi:hypothetical protein
LQVSYLAQERVPLGAYVDAEQKAAVRELAQRSDRSVSSIVRRALAAELERSGDFSSRRPNPAAHGEPSEAGQSSSPLLAGNEGR